MVSFQNRKETDVPNIEGKRSIEFTLSVNHSSGSKATNQRMWQKKILRYVKIEDFLLKAKCHFETRKNPKLKVFSDLPKPPKRHFCEVSSRLFKI